MHHQEREQRRRQAQIPLKERLLWLEEALELARRIQAGRRPGRPSQGSPATPSHE
jgi:hypothetical protein